MKEIDPCTLVIFGAGGNLSRRKLIPAFFHLEMLNRLPAHLVILGCDIAHQTHEAWRESVTGILRERYSAAGRSRSPCGT